MPASRPVFLPSVKPDHGEGLFGVLEINLGAQIFTPATADQDFANGETGRVFRRAGARHQQFPGCTRFRDQIYNAKMCTHPSR